MTDHVMTHLRTVHFPSVKCAKQLDASFVEAEVVFNYVQLFIFLTTINTLE